jgi:molybdopterin molybdotransferase
MQFDALLVTGGMSMGRHDYVPRLLKEFGVQMKITKVRIKPGKPFVFGISRGGCFVFGLPGNPVSGFVCTIRLVSRLLARLGGGGVEERWMQGKLLSPLAANDAREFYQPVVLEYGTQEIGVRPLRWKGSADLATLAQANGLMVRREHEAALPAGARVQVLSIEF